ncbi:MAG: hypothetical protein OSB41_11185 [Kiritimatiellae bacterium]|nr:hypothetical protein [Kiritimatiellia bacterium]
MSNALEIVCDACGQESLLRREPVYEGFTKVGESLSCMACGHTYADEADVPFKSGAPASIFSDADKSKLPDVFDPDVDTRNCRNCQNYLQNPFTQWCTVHRKDVDALDTCPSFKRAEPKEEEDPLF